MEKVYKVLIADDHADAREAIREILSTFDTYEIIGEALDGKEAIIMAESLEPDLILMDINMPRMDGLKSTREIKAAFPSIKIIILTVSDDSVHLFEALKEGAQGYLLKNVTPIDWKSYMDAVMEETKSFSKGLVDQTLSTLLGNTAGATRPPLTSREEEVMKLAASGATNKQISTHLHISEYTVKNHLKNIHRKLHVKSRVELTRLAYENRWIES
ncbi:response regulator [Thalassobacillus hwangdonensis]|uniref:Response regulator n=1 Tax=Thalassobacillus hwangdonensis TaxID=546108 RepID=A0ABW3L7Z5_9BACI